MQPTPRTQAEADRVELVYQYVLAQLGAKTVNEVLALWASVPAGQAAQTKASWVKQATKAITFRRGQAKELGIAYYRVARALRTGTTMDHPFRKEAARAISLELLRQEFESLVAEHTGEGSMRVSAAPEPTDDNDSIDVETFTGVSEALEADEKDSLSYVKQLLGDMATNASKRVSDVPDETPYGEARAKAKELHAQHGAMIAAAGARTAMNGGRNATNQASARDPRVKGWIRQHGQSDQPCYFCALHISRRVLYKSEQSAGKGKTHSNAGNLLAGDGMFKFHDNCHCVAVEVYYDVDFSTNPKYSQNRYYANLWDKHVKGKYSGDDAINEWRKLLKRIRANETPMAAQAAA